MAQNITLLGASYSDVPSVELPKTGGGTAQFDDTTIASNAASASDITSGKLAFVNGELVTGTASGGSATLITKSITANGTYNASSDSADGYSSVTVNVSGGGGGGGLVYETGTWTPVNSSGATIINFANSHSVAPFYYMICDATGTYSSRSSSNYLVSYFNYHQFTGSAIDVDNGTTYQYANALNRYRSGTTTVTSTTNSITTPYTDSADDASANSRYWATETGIRAHSTSASRYWRAGRTYKWIAVWLPTS